MTVPVFLNDIGLVCALGATRAEVARRLFAADCSGMVVIDAYSPGRPLCLGPVRATLPEPEREADRTRNHRLLLAALEPLRPALRRLLGQLGRDRIGVVIGSSIAGIPEGECAFGAHRRTGSFPVSFTYRQQELGRPAQFLAETLGVAGPAYTVSTACSSGAKALASAARLLQAGICDAVVAGGSDALCRFTVAGFAALDSLSADPSSPFMAKRSGINLGEAAALFLVTREPGPVLLSGAGESSDAHHISAPDPRGAAVLDAMRQALERAGLSPGDIDYINLHGTGTEQNDAMEAKVVHALFGPDVWCSSTKPLTGHTLGAAGALEAAFCYLALTENPERHLPPHAVSGEGDAALPPIRLVPRGARAARLRHCVSNSFGFGGSNCVLVMSTAGDDAVSRQPSVFGETQRR